MLLYYHQRLFIFQIRILNEAFSPKSSHERQRRCVMRLGRFLSILCNSQNRSSIRRTLIEEYNALTGILNRTGWVAQLRQTSFTCICNKTHVTHLGISYPSIVILRIDVGLEELWESTITLFPGILFRIGWVGQLLQTSFTIFKTKSYLRNSTRLSLLKIR